MARHESAAWICHECPRDAVFSMAIPSEMPQGLRRRIHLCRSCAVTAMALFEAYPHLGDPEVRYVAARRGVCRGCGCTAERACPGGCAWTNRDHTWCSACAELHAENILEDLVSKGLLRKVSA